MRSFVAVSLAALALVTVACWGGDPSYAALRQSTVEEVPGTWGLVLRPPPTDLAPSVTPATARAIAFAQRPPGQVLETLALVPGSFVGTQHESTAWVVFARDLCYAQSKGDLVSSSRRDPNDVQRCSDRNLWVTMIDPSSGERLSSVGAYDTSGRWTPTRGSA